VISIADLGLKEVKNHIFAKRVYVMNVKKQPKLTVQNLAQIRKGTVEFADFTLIVGPQASGKSIFLQLLKLIIDRHNIIEILRMNNYDWGKDADTFFDLYFGEGMSGMWKNNTKVLFNEEEYEKSSFLPQRGKRSLDATDEKLFYVPAQRVVTIAQGYPLHFGGFGINDPFVIKQFSETIRILMDAEISGASEQQMLIFPKPNRIKEPLRDIIDESIFCGASVEVDKSRARKSFVLKMKRGKSGLPFLAWSAGQKEFMPLLASLYYLLPSAKVSRRDKINWVVIEEPEMGLHPKAIEAVMILCMELLWRGYKLVISTHSPVMLELAWAMNYFQKYNVKPKDLFELFNLPRNQALENTFYAAINSKTFATYYFNRMQDLVQIENISSLDAGNSKKSIANWGGLTDFASRAGDTISKLIPDEE